MVERTASLVGRWSPLLSDAVAAPTVNLQWLFWLRNIAIAGQTVAVAITVSALHLTLPVPAISLIIVSLLLINLLTWWRLRFPIKVTHGEFFAQLIVDVLALTGLLYLTGGATNPFTWFFLLPLTIAAALLPKPYIWGTAGLTVACYTLLMAAYVPFPYADLHPSGGFGLHVFGMWLGFVISAGIVAYFVVAMADNVRQHAQALASAREQALRDERVVALGTLAAGAAHELGTPLGTMALLAEELQDECTSKGLVEFHARLRLLQEQVNRCKEGLSVIAASAGETRAEAAHPLSVDLYLSELVGQLRRSRPDVQVHYEFHGSEPPPVILCERMLSQALLSILNNAADASPQAVELDGDWSSGRLVIQVADRGGGLSTAASATVLKAPITTKPGGLGLGLFLAQAAIKRLGGQVSLYDRAGGGTCTRVEVPLAALAARAIA